MRTIGKEQPVPEYPCPCCGNRDVRRSHLRHLYEISVLPLVFLRPYRCPRCFRRFYRFSLSFNALRRALISLAIWIAIGGICVACWKAIPYFRR